MTTVYLSDKQCFLCGDESRHPVGPLPRGSTGERDLDGRPTHILRSSVYLWIQRCPACGYCAPEIAKGDEADRRVVETEAYRAQLADVSFPQTANALLCYGLIMRNRELFADAAWAAVFASWICDDNDYCEGARRCRGTAIELFEGARRRGQDFAESREQEEVYLIDLHRRCSQFAAAAKRCDEAIGKQPSGRILDLLYLERKLVDNKDTAAHGAETDDAA